MPSQNDREFGRVALECDLLSSAVLHVALREQARREGRGESTCLDRVLLARGDLTAEEVALVEEALERRIAFCPHCSKRSNVFGIEPETIVECTQCQNAFPVWQGSQQAVLSPGGPASRTTVTARPVDRTQRVGERYIAHFRIDETLGRGGMGIVYRATDARLARQVALKVIPGRMDERTRRRFEAECGALSKVDHPGVVRLYGADETGNVAWIALEYVRGRTLEAVVDRDGPLAAPQALTVARRLCEAVAAIHAENLVHRDLKPANVMITEPAGDDGGAAAVGEPKIIDFGIVVDLFTTAGLTASGVVVGSPSFMAPEQARGEGPEIDERSDTYGLGALLYYMLAGVPPHQGKNTRATLLEVVHNEAIPLTNFGVSVTLAAIVRKAMSRRKQERYSTPAALAADIGAFEKGEPTSARVPSMSARLVRWIGGRRRTLRSVLFFVVLCGALLGAMHSGSTLAGWHRELAYTPVRAAMPPVPFVVPMADRDERTEDAVWRGLYRTRRGDWTSLDEGRRAGLVLWRGSLVTTARARALGLHVREGRALHATEMRRLGLYSVAGAALTPRELAARGLFAYRGRGYTRRELASHAPPLYGRAGRAYTREDLAGSNLFGIDGVAYTRRELAAAQPGLFGYRGGVLRGAEARQRGLYPWRNLALERGQLAALDLYGRGGRVLTLPEALAAGPVRYVKEWSAPAGGDPVRAFAFAPSGGWLVLATASGGLRRVDPSAGRVVDLEPAGAGVVGLSVSARARTVAVATAGRFVLLRSLAGLPERRVEHSRQLQAVALHPSGAPLASATRGSVYLWGRWGARGEEIVTDRNVEGDVSDLRFSADGARLAAADSSGKVRVWVVTARGFGHRTDVEWGRRPAAARFFGPGGLAVAGSSGAVGMFDVRTGVRSGTLGGDSPVLAVSVAALAPAGLLAVAGEDGEVVLRRMPGGAVAARLSLPGGPIVHLAADPEGRRLAALGEGGAFEVWGLVRVK